MTTPATPTGPDRPRYEYGFPPGEQAPPPAGAPDYRTPASGPSAPPGAPPQFGRAAPPAGAAQFAGPQYGGPQYGGAQYGGPPQGVPPRYGAVPAPQRSVVSAGGAPGRRPRRPAVIAVAVVAALALVGAGVAFLPRLLGGAAAGPQPAVVVPSTAVAYASLDLNPGLTQKAAAVQFLSKFPTFQGQLTEATDLRKTVFEQLQRTEPDLFGDVDFDADVKPWLGDRFAIAAVAGQEGDTLAAVVLAATDEAKARTLLDRLTAKERDTECAVAGGFAVCAERGTLGQVMVTDRARSLDASAAFAGDIAAVPGDSIGTVWTDLGAAARLAGESVGGADVTAVTGRLAGKLRFDGGTAVEFAGVTRGTPAANAPAVTGGTALGSLPADTVAAVSVNGLGDQVLAAWPEVVRQAGESQIAQAEQSLGIILPADLAALLGDRTTVALGGTGLIGLPEVALVTDGDAAPARRVAAQTGGFLTVRDGGGRVVLATTPGYADEVTGGGLGDSPAFRAAVPQAATAEAAAYLDVAGFVRFAGSSVPAENRRDLDVLQAVGISATQRGGDGSFVLRLTAR